MKRWLILTLIALGVLVPVLALAQVSVPAGGNPPVSVPAGGNQPVGGQVYTVPNPLGINSVCGLIKALLQAAIEIGIPIAVLFIVWAGFKFVLARGSPDKLKEARQNFLYTLIGIAIFLGAWLIASVIANTINQLGGNQQIVSCR